jgi:hypothetical protein
MRLKGNASSARRRDSRLEEPVSPLAVDPFATSAMTGSRGIAAAIATTIPANITHERAIVMLFPPCDAATVTAWKEFRPARTFRTNHSA